MRFLRTAEYNIIIIYRGVKLIFSKIVFVDFFFFNQGKIVAFGCKNRRQLYTAATVKFVIRFDEKLYRNKYLNNDYAFLNLY